MNSLLIKHTLDRMRWCVLSVDDSLLCLHIRVTDRPEEKFSCHFICQERTHFFQAPRTDILEMACCAWMISTHLCI